MSDAPVLDGTPGALIASRLYQCRVERNAEFPSGTLKLQIGADIGTEARLAKLSANPDETVILGRVSLKLRINEQEPAEGQAPRTFVTIEIAVDGHLETEFKLENLTGDRQMSAGFVSKVTDALLACVDPYLRQLVAAAALPVGFELRQLIELSRRQG